LVTTAQTVLEVRLTTVIRRLPAGAVDGGRCVLFGDALVLAEADAEGEAEGEALRLGEADGEGEAEGGEALPGPDRSGAAT
jgi:hypothetical protein